METLRPGYERVAGIGDVEAEVAALEKEAILVSLKNLVTFPFVREAVDHDELTLHGLWVDIGEGALFQYEPSEDSFQRV